MLAQLGAHVILTSRDEEKGRQVVKELESSVVQAHEQDGKKSARDGPDRDRPRLPGKIESWPLDLSKLESVRKFVSRFQESGLPLHVLVNNAAVASSDREVTVNGYENQFQVNHLAPFLLTLLLMETLQASAPSRIINVSSSAHLEGRIELDNLQAERNYHLWSQYCNTKLMNVVFTNALGRRLQGTGVVTHALDPGFVLSEFTAEWPWSYYYLHRLLATLFARPTQQGAVPVVYLATDPDPILADSNLPPKYFARLRPANHHPIATDQHLQQLLWDVSIKLAENL